MLHHDMSQACRYCESTHIKPHCVGRDILHALTAQSFPYFRCSRCGSIFRESDRQEDSSIFYPANYAPYFYSRTSKLNPKPASVMPSSEPSPGRLRSSVPLRKQTLSERSDIALRRPGGGSSSSVRKLLRKGKSTPKRIISWFRQCTTKRYWSKWVRASAHHVKISTQHSLNGPTADIYEIARSSIHMGDRVCDYGCGSPRFLELLQINVGKLEATAVDIVAHDPTRFMAIGAKFMHADDFWESSDQFHLINMNHVLEHIPDPEILLRRLRTKLLPGGVLLITTPNAGSLWSSIFLQYWFALDCPRHINIPTLKSLHSLAGRTGYAIKHQSLQFRYNDFARSLISFQAVLNGQSFTQRLQELYGSQRVSKSRRSDRKAISAFLDLFRIRAWFLLACISRFWGSSDRIIVTLSPDSPTH